MILPKKTRNKKNLKNKTFKRIHKKKIGGAGNNDMGIKNFDKHYKLNNNYYEAGSKDSKIGVKKNLVEKEKSVVINDYENKIGNLGDYQVGEYINLTGNDIILKCVSINQESVFFIRVKSIPKGSKNIDITNLGSAKKTETETETEPGSATAIATATETAPGTATELEKTEKPEPEPDPETVTKLEPDPETKPEKTIEIKMKELKEHIYFSELKDLLGQVLLIVGDGLAGDEQKPIGDDFNSDNNIIVYVLKYDNLIKEKQGNTGSLTFYYDKLSEEINDDQKTNIKEFTKLRIKELDKVFEINQRSGVNIHDYIVLINNLKTKYETFQKKINSGSCSIKNSNNRIINFNLKDIKNSSEFGNLKELMKTKFVNINIDEVYNEDDDILKKFLETLLDIVNKFKEMLNFYKGEKTGSSKGGGKEKKKNYSFQKKSADGENMINNENNPGIFSASHTNSTITINEKNGTTGDKTGISFDNYEDLKDYEVNSCFKIDDIILKCISLEMKDEKPEAKFSIVKECKGSMEIKKKK